MTAAIIADMARRDFIPMFGTRPAIQLSRRELQDESIRPTLLKHPRKATQLLSRVRCAYAHAVEQGRLPDSFNPPTLGIKGLGKVFVFPSRLPGQHVARKALGLAQYTARHADPESGAKDPIEVPWTVHDLRRTVATGLARLGCPRVVQDRILNHVDGSVAVIYDHHT